MRFRTALAGILLTCVFTSTAALAEDSKSESGDKSAKEESSKESAKSSNKESTKKSAKKEESESSESADSSGSAETLLDLAHKHGYKSAWASMFKGEFSIPAWLQNLDANATPVNEYTVDGKKYLIGSMCKATDCLNDRLIAAFSADHKKCWGLEITVPTGLGKDAIRHPKKYASLQFYGQPDNHMRKVLMGHLEKDPSWK